ncbi:FtsX-like permease family protein [Branchiibius sp. NY16-3462-2]|uniref:FtsX-like permease family protein n=1 Tax=Branchiibius sp. NY16-3462-2 TaxID=1807500 RepID=UPI0025BCDF68|nr:FtsX-like permease family protein [Branchiibius sp. NY16-3462-2]
MTSLVARARSSRRGQHVVVTVVVALIVATVALIPLVERSFSAGLVDYRVQNLPPVSAQVEVAGPQRYAHDFQQMAWYVDPRLRAVTEAPVDTTQVTAMWADQSVLVLVQNSDGQCQQIKITSGRCPSAANEILVSDAALTAQKVSGIKLGSGIDVQQVNGSVLPQDLPKKVLKVVGSFTATATSYWGGVDPSRYAPPNPARTAPNQVWLTGPATFDTSQGWYSPNLSARFPLKNDAINANTLSTAVAGSAKTSSAMPDGVTITEPLTQVQQDIAVDLDQVKQLVPLLFVQLLILVLILAYQVFSLLTNLRRSDAAVLKMRGHDRRSLLRFAVGEFAGAVLLGLPIGLLIAYLADAAIGRFILPTHTLPSWNWWALLWAVLAVLAAIALFAVIWSRMTRTPIIDLMRAAPRRVRGVPVSLIVAGALAFAGVVLAATGNLSGAPSLLVPTLAAIVLATLLAAGLGVVGAALVRRLFSSGRATGALGLAQTIRRPGVVPVLTTLIIATTLVSFSASLLMRGDENRQARATADIGAAVVVGASSSVTGAVDPSALLEAVDKTDPSHTHLTPVIEISAASDNALATVGVIPADMKRIAATDGLSSSVPWDALAQPGLPAALSAITSDAVTARTGSQLTAPSMADRDGQVTVVATTAYIPGVPLQAVVVDLKTMLAAGSRTDQVLESVWSSTTDPAVLQRLKDNLGAAGFDLINVNSIAQQRAKYDATATAWSMHLSLLLGAAAVLVALLSLATMVTATRRQRAVDVRSLAAAGVPRRMVARATTMEFLLVAVVAAVLGLIAAPVGATIVGDSLPWWSTPPDYPVTRTGFAWPAGVGAVLVLFLVLAIIAVLVSRRALRAAGGAR